MANYESQVQAAKAFLLQSSSVSKSNLYDHISDCLTRILDERTPNAVDVFENISNSVKQEKLQPLKDTLQDQQGPSERADLADKQKQLFVENVTDPANELDAEEEVSIPFPDLMNISKCLEAGGIGLNREEMFRISLAMKQLTQTQPLATTRFWGKVFGTQRDYLVVEAEFQEGEGEEEGEGSEDGEAGDPGEDVGDDAGEDGSEAEKDEPPKSQWKPPPTVPKEPAKTGANTKTYFVCNQAGDPWTKLPHVTPAQIAISRQIKKLFTGNLDTPIVSFPPFPGNESNYLRAQIARISATTHISPNGYFQPPDDDEPEEDEEEGLMNIEPNPEFEAKISEYADISNWCHHVPYLLPQGRTTWWNPVSKAEDDIEVDEEEEEEEKEQLDEPEPETGPPLLTSAAEDTKVDGMPAWSARLSSNTLPQYAVAIASSNLWPGAHAYTVGSIFENIYIGWGLKYSSQAFNPQLPPPVQEEFPAGADITEASDPTAEQEAALKAAQEEAQANMDDEEEPEDSDDD